MTTIPDLPTDPVARFHALTRLAQDTERDLREQRAAAVRELLDDGDGGRRTYKEVAALLGISRQRVAQLLEVAGD